MKHCPIRGVLCDSNCALHDDYTNLCCYIATARALTQIAKTLEKFRNE